MVSNVTVIGKRPQGCGVDIVGKAYLWWISSTGRIRSNKHYKHGGGPYHQHYSNGCGVDGRDADCAAKAGIIW